MNDKKLKETNEGELKRLGEEKEKSIAVVGLDTMDFNNARNRLAAVWDWHRRDYEASV